MGQGSIAGDDKVTGTGSSQAHGHGFLRRCGESFLGQSADQASCGLPLALVGAARGEGGGRGGGVWVGVVNGQSAG